LRFLKEMVLAEKRKSAFLWKKLRGMAHDTFTRHRWGAPHPGSLAHFSNLFNELSTYCPRKLLDRTPGSVNTFPAMREAVSDNGHCVKFVIEQISNLYAELHQSGRSVRL